MKKNKSNFWGHPQLLRGRSEEPRKDGRDERPQKILLFFLLLSLPFSYYPLISLGSDATMNFELSLPLIFLVIFDLSALVFLFKNYRLGKNYPGLTDRRFFILSWLPFFATVSIFWSTNPLRATLTAGIMWALFFAFFAITHLFNPLKNKTKTVLLKTFFISAIIICAWCFIQCILDVLGISRDVTLLCAGCTYQSFGFPHPNGFAIEPQFMGNLLLAPTLLAFYLFLTRKRHRKTFLVCSFIFTTTLFLTFSRGAIYSFGIALIFMLVLEMMQQKSTKPLTTIPVILISFVIALTFQGIFAASSPTNDTFTTGVAKSIHQLSLGTIDLRPKTEVQSTEITQNTIEVESDFSGYVVESTETRLELSDMALNTWSQDLKTMLFGVGLGGAGISINRHFPDLVDSKEIIQNQYFSILLELGIVGIILMIFGLVVVFRMFKNHPAKNLLFAVCIAFGISLCFFAGLPNALHVYLLPPFLYLLTYQKQFSRNT